MAQSEIQVTTTPPLPGTQLVAEINDALETIATDFSGAIDPAANAFAYSLWADTGTGDLKRRNAANSAWTTIGRIYPAIVENSSGELVNPAYTGTLTGGTGIVNIGSGQVYKDASGNVGIGTSSPSTKLHISGTSGAGDLSGSIRVENQSYTSGSYAGVLFQTADALNSYVTAVRQASFGGILAFGTNDGTNTTSIVERARIDASGNLLVGSVHTNPVASRVNGNGFLAAGGLVVRCPGGNSYLGLNATSGNHLNFYTDNGSAFVSAGNISSNGGTTTYNSSSDYRMKENVQPMTGALDKVLTLKPVTYTWKPEFAGTNPNGQGFIAHELQAVVPDCVTGEKDAVETVDDLDAEGKKIGTKEVPRYQGIDTSFLVATLVAAIQELKSEFDAYKATHP